MIKNPIRNSIIVAALALVISLMIHVPGLFFVFDGTGGPDEEGVPEATESAAFEDFIEEALEPEEPEPAEEVEPEDIIEADESTDVQVASENPQDVIAPDTGTALQNLGRIEPTEEVTATAPPALGEEIPTPEGTPEVAPTPAPPLETEEIVEATEPDVTDAIEEAVEEALNDVPELETVDDGEVQIAAVTRSPRPPSRPTQDTLGEETGEADNWEQQGVEGGVSAPLSGLDLLADAGRTALYGRESLEVARSVGNSTSTNYRGLVFTQLNRSPRLYRSEKGAAIIRFEILPNGQVGQIKILDTRGSPNISFAAQANVRNAAPFPPPPNGQTVELTLTFRSR
ncbi:MAG: TonB family protein [Pseudomonadota bacterium]